MGGGLMQLVAYGAQDIYLTGNPQITFFKVVYRRHTNFAMESIQQAFMGDATFGKRATATVSRNGDLIHTCYLHVELPALETDDFTLIPGVSPSPSPSPAFTFIDDYKICWSNYVGLGMIESVVVEIGGQQIDKHYGIWMYCWQELTMSSEKEDGYKRMVGGYGGDAFLLYSNADAKQTLHIPLMFWFCSNAGLSLPLIALQYHEVKFIFNFKKVSECVVIVNSEGHQLGNEEFLLGQKMQNATQIATKIDLYIDYIYLDTDERRRFAQMSHEYLIEQVQQQTHNVPGDDKGPRQTRLNFNHPCKCLMWVFQRIDNQENNDIFNFSTAGRANGQGEPGKESLGGDVLQTCTLKLNGHSRITPDREHLYFRCWQPYNHFPSMPNCHLYTYSFGLRPAEHQPSGTCNFSRIDNSILEYRINTGELPAGPMQGKLRSPLLSDVGFIPPENYILNIFTINYNVLRIMSGMGGLAYSN